MGPDSTPRQSFDRVYADYRRDLYTCFPARVVRYYEDRQTVDVEPAVMREVPGEEHEPELYEDLGELVNIPIQWPRAGGRAFTFPLKAGDWVKVHCSMQSTLVWRVKGEVHSHPGINDPHGLNGCWAEPGCFPDNAQHTLKNVSTENIELRTEDGQVFLSIAPDGTITLNPSASPGTQVTVAPDKIELKSADVVAGSGPAPQAVALAELVKAEIGKAVLGHTHVCAAAGAASANGVLVAPVGDVGAQNLRAT